MPLLVRDLFRTKKGIVSVKTFTCNEWVRLKKNGCVPGSPLPLNRKPGYHLHLNVSTASGSVEFVSQEQVFQDPASPKVATYLGRGFSAGVCFGVAALLTSTGGEIPPRGKAGLFPLSALAATASAEEPRSRSQTLVCVPQVKESLPLMMKYLDCLENTLFWTPSAASFITFVLSACQEETHLE